MGWAKFPGYKPLYPCVVYPLEEVPTQFRQQLSPRPGQMCVWWYETYSCVAESSWVPWGSKKGAALAAQAGKKSARGTLPSYFKRLVVGGGWMQPMAPLQFMDKVYQETQPQYVLEDAEGSSSEEEGASSEASQGEQPSEASDADLDAESDAESDAASAQSSSVAARPRRAGKTKALKLRLGKAARVPPPATADSSDSDADLYESRPARTPGAPRGTKRPRSGEQSSSSLPPPPKRAPGQPSAQQCALPPASADFTAWAGALIQHQGSEALVKEVLEAFPAFPSLSINTLQKLGCVPVLKRLRKQFPALAPLAGRLLQQWKAACRRLVAATAAGKSPGPDTLSPDPPDAEGGGAPPPAPATAAAAGAEAVKASALHTPAVGQPPPPSVVKRRPTTQAEGNVLKRLLSAHRKPAKAARAGPTLPVLATSCTAGLACPVRQAAVLRVFQVLEAVAGAFSAQDSVHLRRVPLGTLARRLELHVAQASAVAVPPGADAEFGKWGYLELLARHGQREACCVTVADPATVGDGPVSTSRAHSMKVWGASAETAPQGEVYEASIQALEFTLAFCSPRPEALGAVRPPVPVSWEWEAAGGGSGARLAHSWREAFPPLLMNMVPSMGAHVASAAGLLPAARDGLKPLVAYVARWVPPWASWAAASGRAPGASALDARLDDALLNKLAAILPR